MLSEEYKNREITISRNDLAQAISEATNARIIKLKELKVTKSLGEAFTAMLLGFGADIMLRLFGDEDMDNLEVDD